MKLRDILNRTTSGLATYSQLVNDAVVLFNKVHPPIGKINHDPSNEIPPDEDRLDYWDEWHNDITFGRYLLFNKPNEVIPFWTGFSTTLKKTIYCIWFEKKKLSKKHIGKLKSLPNFIIRESCKELWILMDDTVLANFCNSCTNPGTGSQTLKDFWHRVLGVL